MATLLRAHYASTKTDRAQIFKSAVFRGRAECDNPLTTEKSCQYPGKPLGSGSRCSAACEGLDLPFLVRNLDWQLNTDH